MQAPPESVMLIEYQNAMKLYADSVGKRAIGA
jgi:hypothetical protein